MRRTIIVLAAANVVAWGSLVAAYGQTTSPVPQPIPPQPTIEQMRQQREAIASQLDGVVAQAAALSSEVISTRGIALKYIDASIQLMADDQAKAAQVDTLNGQIKKLTDDAAAKDAQIKTLSEKNDAYEMKNQLDHNDCSPSSVAK